MPEDPDKTTYRLGCEGSAVQICPSRPISESIFSALRFERDTQCELLWRLCKFFCDLFCAFLIFFCCFKYAFLEFDDLLFVVLGWIRSPPSDR
jgi:hypothetical protein